MGMQKVLCRFMWLTSAPMLAGEVSPTWALRLAPSMNLAAVGMNDGADLANVFLEHAVGDG